MKWRILLNIAVSTMLIGWLLARTPVSEIGASLSALKFSNLTTALLLIAAAWWLSALRLWFLAPEFRLLDVVRMTLVGMYYGTVLPGQMAGDVVKAYRLSHWQNTPGQAAAVTLVDRVVSLAALFLLGACATPWVTRAPDALMLALVLATTAILVGMAVLAHPRAHALITRWLGSTEPTGVRALPMRLVNGLHIVLQHPFRLFSCFLLALVFHGLVVAIHVVLARGLGIDLTIADWFLVYAGMSLLLLLPISIAGLGLREGGYVGLLAIFGVSASPALSLSFALFAYGLFGALLGWITETMWGRIR